MAGARSRRRRCASWKPTRRVFALQASRGGGRGGAVGAACAAFTRAFEDQTSWLTVHTSKTAVAVLIRVSWRSVGGSATGSRPRPRRGGDPLSGFPRLGVDEISLRKGHRYLTIVVDDDTGRLSGRDPGRDSTVLLFPRSARRGALRAGPAGVGRYGPLDLGSGRRALPDAELCLDPFHVIKLATDALDEVRREVWNHRAAMAINTPREGPQGRPLRALEEPQVPH